MEEIVKIHETENFSKLLKAIKVIQLSDLDKFGEQLLESEIFTVPDIIDQTGPYESLTCSFCKVNFTDSAQQRLHYKSDWHRYNLKQKLKCCDPISEEQFEQQASDVSSISGSDSEKEDSVDDGEEGTNNFAVYRGKIFFQNGDGKVFSIFRCLLHDKKDTPNDEKLQTLIRNLTSNKIWTILMLGGGHFAGAVFEGSKVLVHKTFHCYTVRAKQGGSQGSRDNRSGSNIKSAGASLRRYNEQQLVQHVGDILQTWENYIEKSNLIIYRAAGPYNRSVLFGGKNPVLKKNDGRLRTIPFSTRRPTYTELLRVFEILTTIHVYNSIENIKSQFEKQKEEQANNTHGSRKDSPRNKSINRAKSRESKERPLPAIQKSSSESEDSEIYNLETTDHEISLNDTLQAFEDTVPKSIKKSKSNPKKKRTKKKDKIKEISENLKKQLYNACSKGDLDEILKILDGIKENKFNENPDEEILKLLNSAIDEHGNTALHLAAINRHENLIIWLMENEASPCNKNDKFQTPYTINADKEIRNVFRKFASDYPEKYNYAKSQIPVVQSTLTEEEIAEKKKAQKKAKREREKEKKKEHEIKKQEIQEKERFVNLSDREKRALAAERRLLSQAPGKIVLARCFLCGEDITGKVPFEYSGNRFCSIDCLKAHRMKTTLTLSC